MRDALKLHLFSSESHPQRVCFPFRTQGHQIIHTGTSRPHSGGGIVPQNKPPTPLRANFSTPQNNFNSLCRRHTHIKREIYSHANSHKIPSTHTHTREVGVCFSGLTVGIMTSPCPPPTSLFRHCRVIQTSKVGSVNAVGSLSLSLQSFFILL